jgi:hypothetical protein
MMKILTLVILLGFACPEIATGRAQSSSIQDREGWSRLNSMIEQHTVINFKGGMTMAEKVRAMRMIHEDVAAISKNVDTTSLLKADQREQFFERLNNNAVFVRNGTLFAAPPDLPECDLMRLRRAQLWELAQQCGLTHSAFASMGKADAAARIRALSRVDAPARDKLMLLPRAELFRLCHRFTQRPPPGPRSSLTKARLAERLLRLRWRGLPLPALEHAVKERLGRAVRAASESQARCAMIRLLEHADAMQARPPTFLTARPESVGS